jgi:hypothetical protein
MLRSRSYFVCEKETGFPGAGQGDRRYGKENPAGQGGFRPSLPDPPGSERGEEGSSGGRPPSRNRTSLRCRSASELLPGKRISPVGKTCTMCSPTQKLSSISLEKAIIWSTGGVWLCGPRWPAVRRSPEQRLCA